jgi:hypothetical protein
MIVATVRISWRYLRDKDAKDAARHLGPRQYGDITKQSRYFRSCWPIRTACARSVNNLKRLLTSARANFDGFTFDHNHKTEEIRGLLCMRCNTGIGFLQEDLTILQSAIEYLKTFNGDTK